VGDEPPQDRVDELAAGTLGQDDDGYGDDDGPLSFEDDADEFDVERRPRPSL
jgi:hypothetical protein